MNRVSPLDCIEAHAEDAHRKIAQMFGHCLVCTRAGSPCPQKSMREFPCCGSHLNCWLHESYANIRSFIRPRSNRVVRVFVMSDKVVVQVHKQIGQPLSLNEWHMPGSTALHLPPATALVLSDELACLGNAIAAKAISKLARELGA
jgi:hypothetical protein